MKRYIVKAPVDFHIITDSPDTARQRLVDIMVSVNQILGKTEVMTMPPETKVAKLPVEEHDL